MMYYQLYFQNLSNVGEENHEDFVMTKETRNEETLSDKRECQLLLDEFCTRISVYSCITYQIKG
jgi:hypothetical protein